jgi:photosystem II stability/assembly factor-like uncharacterized protein
MWGRAVVALAGAAAVLAPQVNTAGGAVFAGRAGAASAVVVSVPTLASVLALSCPSTSWCWAGAAATDGQAVILLTSDGGSRWSVQYRSKVLSTIDALDCTSRTHCVGIAGMAAGTRTSLVETFDGGRAWSLRPTPSAFRHAEAVSCATASDCWAVGLGPDETDAIMIHSTDGGASWAVQPTPRLFTAMSNSFGLSCPSLDRCVATGSSTLTTTDGGRHWADHAIPNDAPPLGPVSCPSSIDCYAVADVTSAVPAHLQADVYASTDGGARFAEVLAAPERVGNLSDLSCPSDSACLAVGAAYTPGQRGTATFTGVAERTTSAGRRWTAARLAEVRQLLAAACAPESRTCQAGGSSGSRAVVLRSADGGRTWTAERLA